MASDCRRRVGISGLACSSGFIARFVSIGSGFLPTLHRSWHAQRAFAAQLHFVRCAGRRRLCVSDVRFERLIGKTLDVLPCPAGGDRCQRGWPQATSFVEIRPCGEMLIARPLRALQTVKTRARYAGESEA